MKANAKWRGRMSFSGSASTGFTVPMGAHPDVGGDNDGFRPLELLAVGLCGCTGMDVISILKKKRQDVTDFEVKAQIDQADTHPHVFTNIKLDFIVTGRNVDPKAVERAIELSQTRYCSASAMLESTAQIETSYQIIKVET